MRRQLGTTAVAAGAEGAAGRAPHPSRGRSRPGAARGDTERRSGRGEGAWKGIRAARQRGEAPKERGGGRDREGRGWERMRGLEKRERERGIGEGRERRQEQPGAA